MPLWLGGILARDSNWLLVRRPELRIQVLLIVLKALYKGRSEPKAGCLVLDQ